MSIKICLIAKIFCLQIHIMIYAGFDPIPEK
jgi:hypothetical protein